MGCLTPCSVSVLFCSVPVAGEEETARAKPCGSRLLAPTNQRQRKNFNLHSLHPNFSLSPTINSPRPAHNAPRPEHPPPSAGSGSGARSRARNNPKTRSLNAFSIAQSTATATATRRRRPSKHTPTAADPDPDPDTTRRADSASIDGGSDSDGGHWRVGVGSGDDSESDIDSDEALGASDEERFAGFAFRGSSSSGNKNKKKEKEKKKKGVVTLDESDDDDEDAEEEEDDGEGFVDLSEMLDRATPSGSESGDEAEEAAGKLQKNRPKKRPAPESESEDDSAGGLELEEPSMSEADDDSGSGSDSDSNDSFAHFSEEEEDDDDGGDPAALAALQSRIAALPSGSKHASKRARLDTDPNEGKTPNEYNLAPTPHTKLTITDLLPTIADRTLKKSLKTLSSDGTTAKSSGMQAGKLAAPLPKRQQDRIDRAAAYVQTTTALGRWAATVKTQREAEHLRFPLPNAPNAPVATPQRLLSLSATEARGGAGAQTELEATVSRILKESNMASERRLAEFEELQTNRMSVEEVQRRTAELRMARELLYREELRAKRVKKIKSKAYRRVHKKERARQEQAVEEALALERGGKEVEEEVMERERRRAEERMTLRHKQSRWAKGMRESGRSVWDDEAQEGAVEMARRAEELTRRIRGKGVRGEFGESGGSSSSSSEDGEDEEDEDDDAFDEEGVELRRKLAKDIEKAEASLGVSSPGAGSRLGGRLMGMKFMQTAEAAKRKENDAQLEELKSMLMDADRPGRGSEGEDDEDEKEQEEQQHKQASGRMTFRPGKKEKQKKRPSAADRSEFEEQDLSGQEQQDEDGEEEQEDEEVTFVNRANAAAASSSTAPKNPFTAPRTTAGAAGGKHTSFGAGNDTAAAAAAGNPWLPQDAPPHPQRKQPTLSSSTKTESRTERSSKKLARSRHAALAPAEAEAEVEIDTTATLQLAPKKQQPTPTDADDSEDEVDAKDIHLIPAHRGGGKAAQSQRALVRRAFAGDDVVAQFVEEKRAVVAAEGDRVVDERLPGWGSWAGEGLPQAQTQDDRFVKVVKGVVAPERRKDRRLARVVVNEKRVKKNIKYHASALPHVFETKQQYERSLRIPIGPEWATKTTFQDATMPRVVVKRGVVVEPISAPFK